MMLQSQDSYRARMLFLGSFPPCASDISVDRGGKPLLQARVGNILETSFTVSRFPFTVPGFPFHSTLQTKLLRVVRYQGIAEKVPERAEAQRGTVL